MAFVWCESFHGIAAFIEGNGNASAQLATIYGIGNSGHSGFGELTIIPNFDNGQPGLLLGEAATECFLRMGPGIVGNNRFSSQNEWFVHFAMNIQNNTVTVAGDTLEFLHIQDTTLFPANMTQCRLGIRHDGPSGLIFVLLNWDGTSTILEGSHIGTAGIHYIQFYIKIGNASGASRLIVSGVEHWNTTGIDTQETANATADAFRWTHSANQGNPQFGNIVIADGQDDGFDPPFNQLLGEFVVGKIQPNADGDAKDFNPVGTLNNWDNVNDYPWSSANNEELDYNETSTSGNKDVHQYEDVNNIPGDVIYGINLRTKARKTDAGARTLTNIIKPSTVEYDGYEHGLLSTYSWFSDSIEHNEDTSERYTETEINAHQFGYRAG